MPAIFMASYTTRRDTIFSDSGGFSVGPRWRLLGQRPMIDRRCIQEEMSRLSSVFLYCWSESIAVFTGGIPVNAVVEPIFFCPNDAEPAL